MESINQSNQLSLGQLLQKSAVSILKQLQEYAFKNVNYEKDSFIDNKEVESRKIRLREILSNQHIILKDLSALVKYAEIDVSNIVFIINIKKYYYNRYKDSMFLVLTQS